MVESITLSEHLKIHIQEAGKSKSETQISSCQDESGTHVNFFSARENNRLIPHCMDTHREKV